MSFTAEVVAVLVIVVELVAVAVEFPYVCVCVRVCVCVCVCVRLRVRCGGGVRRRGVGFFDVYMCILIYVVEIDVQYTLFPPGKN